MNTATPQHQSHATSPVETANLPLHNIRRDGGTQPRDSLNEEAVQGYAERLADGDTFPPVTVFFDGETYWLADGFHRAAASEQVSLTEIRAEVRQGTRRDAVLHSVGANATHGLPRTNADKRRAVLVLLNDPEWSRWSDREVGRRCNVSNNFVSTLRRAEPILSSDDSMVNERTFVHGRTGEPARMDVTRLRQRRETEPTQPEHPSSNGKAAAIEAPPADGGVPDLLAELEQAHKEIARLETLVESLSASDTAVELRKWSARYAQLDGRLQQAITTGNEAERQATRAQGLLKKIRKAVGAERDSDIMERLSVLGIGV
jgi:ParB-like chromosome segregation protein Spo0J